PPNLDQDGGTYTGRASTYCDTSGNPPSSCNKNQGGGGGGGGEGGGGGGCASCGPLKPLKKGNCGDDDQQVGGADNITDPILLAARSSLNELTDVSVRGSIAQFALTRGYVSSEKTWAYEDILGRLNEPFLPKPFGSAPSWPASLRWWHNLYSFVYPRGWTAGTSTWSVEQGNGKVVD